MLRDEGLIDLERWRSGEARDLPIPTSVQGLISSRLDRLAREEKQLAHHASVVGPVFWAGAVAHLGVQDGTPPDDPRPGLGELERRDFVAHKAVSTVAGEDDPSVPLRNGRLLAERLPDARLHVVRGGGHLFLLDEPERVAPAIRAFLDED